MKRRVKTLSLLMALAMAASIFAACGDDTDSGSTPTDENGKPKEVVTLKWWHWGDPPKNPDAVIEALNKKSAEDIGIKIDFLWATGDDAKLKTALSTGADDDIAFVCSWFASYVQTAQMGQLYDITEKIQSETPNLYSVLPEYVWEAAKVDGKIYAVPVYKDTAATQYWFCNKEYVFDQAGAKEEFFAEGDRNAVKTPLMKKLYDYMKDGHPYPHDLTAPYTYNFQGPRSVTVGDETIQNETGLTIAENDNTYTLQLRFETPNYLADLKTLCEWYQAGYCNQDCLQLQKEPEFHIIGQGQGYQGIEKTEWNIGKDYTIEICRRGDTLATTASAIGAMQGIFANSKHPVESLKFIEYMNTDVAYRNMLAYGVEGSNWSDNGDGTYTATNTDWAPGPWCQANLFLLKPLAPAPATMYDDMKAEMAGAKASDLLGFNPDLTNVKNEVAACSTVLEKYKYELACGTMKDPEAYIKQVKDELISVGWDKVRVDIQNQVDAFLKAKGIDVPTRG